MCESVQFYITHPSACIFVFICVYVETSVHAKLYICSWDGGDEEILVSSNPSVKQDGCNALLLNYTQTHKLINVLSTKWVVSEGFSLFLLASICGQITDIIGCKRDSLSTSIFTSFTLSRAWHVPVHPCCGEGNESQKCCWCVLQSAGFLGFDASQVVEGILRCPLRVEMGEVNIVIWPDCVAACFGCGLVRQPCCLHTSFDVGFKRFGEILERLHGVLRWD